MPENEPHADPHPMVVQNVNPAGPVADPLAGQPLVVKVLVTIPTGAMPRPMSPSPP
jgi:hypothetical protein